MGTESSHLQKMPIVQISYHLEQDRTILQSQADPMNPYSDF